MTEQDDGEPGSDDQTTARDEFEPGRLAAIFPTYDDSTSTPSLSRRTVLGGVLAGIVGTTLTASAADGTFTAAKDGMWSDPTTWKGGSVPTDGSDVSIPAGVTVTVAQRISTRVKYLNVAGTLRHAPDTDTKLRAETIQTEPGSRYEIGTASTPVHHDVTAAVEIIDDGPIDENKWPDRKNKGFLLKGEVELVGAEKTSWTTLSKPATAGDTSIELSSEPTNWRAGDTIVVPGLAPYSSAGLDHEDERRTVGSVSGTTVTFDTALAHDHVPPKAGLDSYVLNLTRNVVFASENTAEHRRGHLMIMSPGSDVRYVRFAEMGRTNKDEPLTNPVRNANTVTAADPNPAARYPFHYHRTGMDTEPHYAEGLAVDGSPGWGVVNHHAHADIVDSVTYDVRGAGFVAEGGNERGSFERNMAVRSSGSGETIDARAAGAHGGDPPIDDFGHAGHGFWLQSPLVEVVDNVAVGHRHQAFVWWLRPLLDEIEETQAECSDVTDSRVTFCPNVPMKYVPDAWPLLEAIEQGRFSTDSMDKLMWDTQKIPSTFAPLATVRGNTAVGAAGGLDFSRHNFKWKHQRFSDFNVIDDMTVYNIGRFYDEDGNVHEPDPPRHLSSGHQGRGGNVGVSFRYTSNVRLTNSHLIGSSLQNSFAVPFHDYRWNNTIDNCTIEGWDWGIVTGEHSLTWIRNNTLKNNTYDVNWQFDNVGPAVLEGNDFERLRNDFEKRNQKAAEVLDTDQGAGLVVEGRTSYVTESAPDHVPFPDTGSLGGINNIESLDEVDDETNLVGLTNAEMQEQYGISIGGALMPDDAVSEPWMSGAKLGPASRSPPRSVNLDAANADTLGGFEVVSDPDAAHDRALRCTGTDDPASISFDCDGGTYEIKARIRPDAWNGDTVDFRVDGGAWKAAEKIKDPASFRWHGAAPNGGDDYAWNLSAGTHTLEFKSKSSDLKIDELFITSDAQTYGAYGRSATDGNDAPVVDDDELTVPNGETETVDVLANDSDTDGSLDASTVTVVDAPSNGSTTVHDDGTIDYTHDGSNTDSDSFTYTVDDDDGATSNEATVSITVQDLSDGLVGHWLFEETSGAVVDHSGNGLDGTNNGATRGVAGLEGSYAVEFDGSSYIDLPEDSLLPSGDGSYALSVWFKAAADHEGGLIGWGDYNNCSRSNAIRVTGLGASDEVSFKHFWWCDDLTADTAVKYGDAWHHVVATYDGTDREIWLDGSRVATDSPSANDAKVANAAIGLTDEEYFDGKIDEVRVYSRSLSTSEITSLYDLKSSVEGDTTTPTAPSNLAASNVTESSVDLSWDAASDSGTGVDHYNVSRDGTVVKQVAAGTTSTSVSGLDDGTSYDFSVTAVDGAGNESDPSNTVTITTLDVKTVKVTGNGAASYNDSSTVRYIIETTGSLDAGSHLETVDVFGGSTASGRVPADGSDSDTYELVDGKVTDVSTWGGDVTLTVDGTTWSG